jgi:hypothetical protein
MGLLPAVFKFFASSCFSLLSFANRCSYGRLDALPFSFFCIPLHLLAAKPSQEPSQGAESPERRVTLGAETPARGPYPFGLKNS